MKTLYESLLDDEDVLDKNTDIAVADSLLKQLDKSISDTNYHSLYSSGKTNSTDERGSYIEDNTLILDYKSAKAARSTINNGTIKILDELHKLTKFDSIKKISGGLRAGSAIAIEHLLELPSYIKNIYTDNSYILYNNCRNAIKNLNFYLSPGSHHGAFRASGMINETISNVRFEITTKSNLIFDYLPVFSNVTGINVQNICIYDGLLFYHDEILKRIDDIFDQSYKAKYYDLKKEDYVFRKTNFKTMRANFANNKRYILDKDLGPAFKINPKFKLKDFLDVSKFDNTLTNIIIREDKIGLTITKDTNSINALCAHTNHKDKYIQQLPNDPDWTLCVYRRN
jgi:hypothetical protein